MRERNVLAAYVIGMLAIVGGIVLYNALNDDSPDSPVQSGPSKRHEAGQGLLIDLSIPQALAEREQPDASPPARRATTPPAIHTSRSAAGGGGSAPAARPMVVSAQPACAQSLLGSVIGLLGSLLGGGGGC